MSLGLLRCGCLHPAFDLPIKCDQPRALDLGASGGKKLESVSDAVMDEVLARLARIFE